MKRTIDLSRVTRLRGRQPLERHAPMSRTGLAVVDPDGAPVVPLRQKPARRETGFPAAVKLAVRKRAGSGEPGDASCEACGRWVGRYEGEIQHRNARGAGGSSDPVTNSIMNAVLLCGSGALRTGCHGLCEDRDEEMNARGFWLRHGEDPAATPIMLASRYGSGVTVWLLPDGTYGTEPPGGETP